MCAYAYAGERGAVDDRHRVGVDHDFVVVANRLPVAVAEIRDGCVEWRRSPGGLVSALEPVVRRTDGVWVGWPGTADIAPDPWDTAGMHLVGVPLSVDEVEQFYEGFCSASLLVDRASGRAVSTVNFDGREALERNREQAGAVRAAGSQETRAEVLEVCEFELALAHLRVPEMA